MQAKPRVRKRPPLERSLQKTAAAHLNRLRETDPTLVWRKRHGSPMARKGDPDITGLWRGVHFEIELKAPGQLPTKLQAYRLNEWQRAGAEIAIVCTAGELDNFLEEIRLGGNPLYPRNP